MKRENRNKTNETIKLQQQCVHAHDIVRWLLDNNHTCQHCLQIKWDNDSRIAQCTT